MYGKTIFEERRISLQLLYEGITGGTRHYYHDAEGDRERKGEWKVSTCRPSFYIFLRLQDMRFSYHGRTYVRWRPRVLSFIQLYIQFPRLLKRGDTYSQPASWTSGGHDRRLSKEKKFISRDVPSVYRPRGYMNLPRLAFTPMPLPPVGGVDVGNRLLCICENDLCRLLLPSIKLAHC